MSKVKQPKRNNSFKITFADGEVGNVHIKSLNFADVVRTAPKDESDTDAMVDYIVNLIADIDGNALEAYELNDQAKIIEETGNFLGNVASGSGGRT